MTPAQKQLMHQRLHLTLNGLHYQENVPVVEINAYTFGLLTCSMENEIGRHQARDFFISAMDNVWPDTKPKPWWRRIFA
jgi:hypothetical protein